MKRRAIVLLYVAALLIVVACRREDPAPQERSEPGAPVVDAAAPQDLSGAQVNTVLAPQHDIFLERARLGSAVGQNGMVETEKSEFARNEPIHLSMWFRESPEGLQASAVVEDAKGKEVARQQKPMNGQKTVTFPISDAKLKPGKYKVTGYWGGNVAAEYDIVVK